MRLIAVVSFAVILSATLGCARLGQPRVVRPTEQGRAYSHSLAAAYHERAGELERAVTELEAAAALDPGAVTLLARTAHIYLYLQEEDKALEACRRALEARPDDKTLWVLAGTIHTRMGNYEAASEAFEQVVALDPDNPLSYRSLLLLEENTNDIIGAIESYQKLIDLLPPTSQLYYKLGLNLARIGDEQGAIKALNRALELNPELVQIHHILGIAYQEAEEYDAAEEHLRRYLDAEPDDLSARENLAGVLVRKGQWEAGLSQMQILVESPAPQVRHHILNLYLLVRMGRYDEALAAPVPEGGALLASVLKGVARFYGGMPYAEVFVNLDSIEGDIEQESAEFLGSILARFGEDDTGLFLLDTIGDIRESGVESKYLEMFHARALMLLERPRDAEPILLGVLERYGSDKATHHFLGMAYEGLDEFEKADHHLGRALSFEPDDPELLNYLGYLYAEENVKLDEAEAMIVRALEADPDNGFYLDSLGWVYYRQGDAEKAIEYIRRAIINMDSDDAVLRDHLGDAYLLNGQPDKALAQWQRARRLDPELTGVQEKIDRHRP